MKVSPYDIRYATVGMRRVNGVLTTGIYTKDHLTRDDAEAKRPPGLSKVIAYISNHRRPEHTVPPPHKET